MATKLRLIEFGGNVGGEICPLDGDMVGRTDLKKLYGNQIGEMVESVRDELGDTEDTYILIRSSCIVRVGPTVMMEGNGNRVPEVKVESGSFFILPEGFTIDIEPRIEGEVGLRVTRV